jgi:hypothetical protein
MYFPWYGHLEQIKHCDTYVFYDDAKYSHGSFFNRVQLLSATKQVWMTIPLAKGQSNNAIKDVYPSFTREWKRQHLDQFKNLYANTTYYKLAFDLLCEFMEGVSEHQSLSQISAASTMSLAAAFGLSHVRFLTSSDLSVAGHGSNKVKDICQHLEANVYITGHGATRYLDHDLFEDNGIKVKYINYGLNKYQQSESPRFIPYVSALDCLAHCGPAAGEYLSGRLVEWQDFIGRQAK